jgi:hypothetical protein
MMKLSSRPGLAVALLCLPALFLSTLIAAQLLATNYVDADSQQSSEEFMTVYPESRPSRVMLIVQALLFLGLWIGGLIALTRIREIATSSKTTMTRVLFVAALIAQTITFPFAVLALLAVLGPY